MEEDLIHNLTIRLPVTFPTLFAAERSAYVREDDHVTLCGFFCALGTYIEANYGDLSDKQQQEFWEWIYWKNQEGDEELSNAVVVCFMESIVDTEAETHCRSFMPQPLVAWCDSFMGRGQSRSKRWFER